MAETPKYREKIFVSKLNGIEILLWNMGITIKFAFHKKIELFSKILTLFSKLGMVLSKCIAGLTHHVTIGKFWQVWRPRLEGDEEGDKKARQCDLTFWNPHAVYIPYVIGKIWLVAQQIPPLLNKVKNLQNNSIFLWNANVIFMPILYNEISILSNSKAKNFSTFFPHFQSSKKAKISEKTFRLKIRWYWNFIMKHGHENQICIS